MPFHRTSLAVAAALAFATFTCHAAAQPVDPDIAAHLAAAGLTEDVYLTHVDLADAEQALATANDAGDDTAAAEAALSDAEAAFSEACLAAELPDIQSCAGALELALADLHPGGAPAPEPPIVEEPVAEQPVVEEPPVEDQAAEEPAVEEPVVDQQAAEEPASRVSEEDAARLTAAGLPPEILSAMEDYNLARDEARSSRTPEAARLLDDAQRVLEELCDEAGFRQLRQCQRAVAEALAAAAPGETPVAEVEKIPEEALDQSEIEALPETVPIEEAAPVLDSQKEAATGPQPPAGSATAQPTAEPAPETDAEAQAAALPEHIESANAETGQRLDPEAVRHRDQPENSEVVERFGLNVVIEFNNRFFVRGNDEDRFADPEDDVFYEQLSNGRIREVIFRPDGSQLVTIYNRNGDVLRRSRITADGRETVLVYVDEQHQADLLAWRDPGEDLPPLQLSIPVREYVFNVSPRTRDEELIAFWSRPPVQRVERLYSVDEIKRSARIRDLARRVEVDDLNFEFGSAAISQTEIRKLATVANVMLELLDRNPGDTFLIEGHADAPGTELVNLRISQLRADTVARTLTDYFGIPPENLVTQGYGERYLKALTEFPERLNRRVVFRRLGPLVSPEFAGR